MKTVDPLHSSVANSQDVPEWMQHVTRFVKQMNYGQITLTIHQGKVVEIQRTERTRLSSGKSDKV